MSDDLISRTSLIIRLRNESIIPFSKMLFKEKHKQILEFEDMIKTQETAYDVDKFVEQLEENAKYFQGEADELAQKGDWGTATDLQGRATAYRDAAKIVKSGGVAK